MGISVIENFFKETITRSVSLTGATSIYLSALPTPDEGYVVISPSSSTLREIVYYTAKGTDGNGTYITVTLANRGLGGTTAQTHAIGEPVRMNVTAEHIKEISDALDQIVAAGAQDASAITKGITKLSVAPASATEPIAVGDNDPRIGIYYGISDGSDGDVVISSGTVTLDRDMFYNNLTVNGTGILETHSFRIFVKGTLKVDSTSGACIKNNGGNGGDGSGQTGGSAGTATQAGALPVSQAGKSAPNGGGINASGSSGTTGFSETFALNNQNGSAGGKSASLDIGGSGGSVSSPILVFPRNYPACYYLMDFPTETSIQRMHVSAGGGSGASASGNASYAGGGGGGSGGGGGIIFLACQTLNLTGDEAIQAKGGNGGEGGLTTGVYGDHGGGGGAGGNGGVIFAVYGNKTGTGTMTVMGGKGGKAGGSLMATAGEDGKDGLIIEITN